MEVREAPSGTRAGEWVGNIPAAVEHTEHVPQNACCSTVVGPPAEFFIQQVLRHADAGAAGLEPMLGKSLL
ncbi:hypothetical protein H8959_011658 [Pygathrix nigripes]